MTTYGWSHISRVYHEVEDQGSHGWVNTVCCGERWIDCTAGTIPEREVCRGQIAAWAAWQSETGHVFPRGECDVCGKDLALFSDGYLAWHKCIPGFALHGTRQA